jgi:hypothetical protein
LRSRNDAVLARRELADRPLTRSARPDGTTRFAIALDRVALTVHTGVNPTRALGAPTPWGAIWPRGSVAGPSA